MNIQSGTYPGFDVPDSHQGDDGAEEHMLQRGIAQMLPWRPSGGNSKDDQCQGIGYPLPGKWHQVVRQIHTGEASQWDEVAYFRFMG